MGVFLDSNLECINNPLLWLIFQLKDIVKLKYLQKSQHVPVQDIFCKVVAHFGGWVQLEMVHCHLVVEGHGEFSLIIIKGIPELVPCYGLSFECQTAGSRRIF